MITCEECGRENDDEYKFCLGCGAALKEASEEQEDSGDSEIINCPFCGAEQPANFKFCGACGEKIPEMGDVAGAEGDDADAAAEGAASSTSPGKPGGDAEAEPAAVSQEETEVPERERSPTPRGSQSQQTEAATEEAPPSTEPRQAPQEGGADEATEAPARLVVIRPDGTEGASIQVPEDKLTIGRASDIEALSGDPFLSPQHASILFQDGAFVIRDEESLNGIFREVTDQTQLQDGDMIRIGQELIEFELYEEETEAQDEETLTAGSPDSGHWGRLTLVAGPDVYTEAYTLDDADVTIGRETGDIVFRDDGFVSGTHARVTRTDGTPTLRDLDSSNGTFIRIRDDYTLEDGERVLMGQQLFRLERR